MAKSFKIKRYALLGFGVATVAAVVSVSALSRGKLKIGAILEEDPLAITVEDVEPNEQSGVFQYETSSDPIPIRVPVPKGYVGSTNPEERYVNGVTSDGVRQHHGGFVIYEKNAGETDEEARAAMQGSDSRETRNQWVWVPIPKSEVAPGRMYGISSGRCGVWKRLHVR